MRDEDGDTLEDRTIARLERRILALEKALRPFAKLADFAVSDGSRVDDDVLIEVRVRHSHAEPYLLSQEPTVGAARRAAATLNEVPRV